jgi:DNA (cytosine-5)-methyltransferase 1
MRIKAADLFCGAGGSSTGLTQAALAAGHTLDLTAVNHDPLAVETHAANHPAARHLCETLDAVNPRKLYPRGKLDLLVASPECTHHSIARGGKPMSDQSRSTAWHVIRWADALRPKTVIVENVREFMTWGPIGANGRPLKRKRGETFQGWLGALRSLGYTAEVRVLCAADYGAATTRTRLFVMAVRGKGPACWPSPTHSRNGENTLFGDRKPWRAAREVIDWSMPGASIFGRKKPLSENTLRRIEAGLRKFGGKAAEPFLVLLRNNCGARSLDEPAPTVCSGGEHLALCKPILIDYYGEKSAESCPLDSPMPTITTRGKHAIVQPFVIHATHRGERRQHGVDAPLPTVTGANRGELAFILPHRQFDGMQTDSLDGPMRTVTAKNGGNNALVRAFILPQMGSNAPRSIDQPGPTITTTSRGIGLCEPFVVKYYGTGEPVPVAHPLDTVTARDRFGLVQPDGSRLDILFRMLQPHELAAAMSFPEGYVFKGNRTQKVKQIGNAVDVRQFRALSEAAIAG